MTPSKTIAFCLIILSLRVYSYDLSIQNTSTLSDPDLPILAANGSLLGDTSSTLRLGFFNSFTDSAVSNFSGSDASALLADFITFGSSPQTITRELGENGFTNNTFIEDLVNGGPDPTWTGIMPYLLVTNNSDSEYGVFKFNDAIGEEDNFGSGSLGLQLSTGEGAILLGSNGGSIRSPANFTNSFMLIPEPSSTILLGLGAVAFITRRKR